MRSGLRGFLFANCYSLPGQYVAEVMAPVKHLEKMFPLAIALLKKGWKLIDFLSI